MDDATKLPIKQGFDALFKDTNSAKDYAMLAAAEQIVIGYYYDMLKAMFMKRVMPKEKLELPEQEPMRRAVAEINQICAGQEKKYLFKGDIFSPADLFEFASAIAMPPKEEKKDATEAGTAKKDMEQTGRTKDIENKAAQSPRDAIAELFQGTKDARKAARVVAAEQHVIKFYMAMMLARAKHQLLPETELEIPDIGPVSRSVEALNQACEELEKEPMFKGDLLNPQDLFNFAEPIGLEAFKERQSGTKRRIVGPV